MMKKNQIYSGISNGTITNDSKMYLANTTELPTIYNESLYANYDPYKAIRELSLDNYDIESTKREINGHIDMLSNLSNSGESVLDDASYEELRTYFDKNSVRTSDGELVGGQKILEKYGITSQSSHKSSENTDADGLIEVLLGQLNDLKKSKKEEILESLSPYLTEYKNIRLFISDYKDIISEPEGKYQSNYQSNYENFIKKAKNYSTKYNSILRSIEDNRAVLGNEWADEAVAYAKNMNSTYKLVLQDVESYRDYWSSFADESDYYENFYSNKYAQSTYSELKSNKNQLNRKLRNEDLDSESIKRELDWIKKHEYDLNFVFTMTDEELEDYTKYREANGLGSEFGYTEWGDTITSKNIQAISAAKRMDNTIQNTPEIKTLWDNIEQGDSDYDTAADLHLAISSLSKQNKSNIYGRLSDEQQEALFYLCDKYGISDMTSDKVIVNASYDLERLIQEKTFEIISEFEEYGYGYYEYSYYKKLQRDALRARELAKSDEEFAREHPVLATILGIVIAPTKIYDFVENFRYTILSKGYSKSVFSIPNIHDDGVVNMTSTITGTVSNMIGEKVYELTESELLAEVAQYGYSGAVSQAQSILTKVVCTALFGPFGEIVSFGVLGAESAADSFNQNARNGNLSYESLKTALSSGIAEMIFTDLFSISSGNNSAVVEGLLGGASEFGIELATFLQDLYINGDRSEFGISINEYLKQGLTQDKAILQALKDKSLELVGAFGAGFISDAVSAYSSVITDKINNQANNKNAVSGVDASIDVVRDAWDRVNSSSAELDAVIAEMRADGINIETLVATERERMLDSMSRAFSETKYGDMDGENRGVISRLEAVETAENDPNYIKKLLAAEYLAEKQLRFLDTAYITTSNNTDTGFAKLEDTDIVSIDDKNAVAQKIDLLDNSSKNDIIKGTEENIRSKSDVLAQNRERGRQYEIEMFNVFASEYKNAVEQVTIEVYYENVRTRVDAIGLDEKGNIVIQEYKSSMTAPLTKNQKIAFEALEKYGGRIVTKEKGIFKHGREIPAGTKIAIIRPGGITYVGE